MFVSYGFIFFICILFAVYYIVPKKLQWVLLLMANFVFYFSAGKYYPLFILASSLTVFLAGVIIGKKDERLEEYAKEVKKSGNPPSREERRAYKNRINKSKKIWMLICLLFNLGILCFVKYTGFIIQNINNVLKLTGEAGISYSGMIVPLGISFYTFQSIGYLMDVYWGKVKPQKNFFKFTLFVSFFPQLIQGPISRYGDMSQTLYAPHKFDFKRVRFGIERILWGYFKKLVIADRVAEAVSAIMGEPDYYTGAWVFFGMIFYAIQLYADFTGGIDITIGIAQTLGVDLKENFIRPFFSKNIAEYWRRWHISMGTWFRDYVFYPVSISSPQKKLTMWIKEHMGMGAAKRVAVYFSTILTWLATGIWHGAGWHFIVWGLTNGIIILISQEFSPLYEKFHKKFPGLVSSAFYRGFQVIRTFLLLCVIRLFDNYCSVRLAIKQFIHMFTRFDLSRVSREMFLDLGLDRWDYAISAAGVIIMFTVSMAGRNGSVREKISQKPYVLRYIIFVSLFFAVVLLGKYGIGYDARQFIYNQF